MGLLNTTYESVACNNTILSGMCLGQILATVVQVFERTRLQEQDRQSTCMHSLSLPYAWSSSYSLLSLPRKVYLEPGTRGSCYRGHESCTEIRAILSHMNVLLCISFFVAAVFLHLLQSDCCDLTESWKVMGLGKWVEILMFNFFAAAAEYSLHLRERSEVRESSFEIWMYGAFGYFTSQWVDSSIRIKTGGNKKVAYLSAPILLSLL